MRLVSGFVEQTLTECITAGFLGSNATGRLAPKTEENRGCGYEREGGKLGWGYERLRAVGRGVILEVVANPSSGRIATGPHRTGVKMKTLSRISTFRIATIVCFVAGAAWLAVSGLARPEDRVRASADWQAATGTASGADKKASAAQDAADARITRGKKLVLKDGSFQLARSYERKGDRVRYYSVERGDWEEIPAALVDWDATAKAERDAVKADDALVSKIHKQEEAAKIETTLDVDASLQVASGVFLPPGEGMFAIEGKSVVAIPQVGSAVKNDRANSIKRILSPIPIIPAKQNVEIPGGRATLRINSQFPEFYLREVQPDYEKDSALERTHRQGVTGPEVELIRAKIKGNKRILESIRSMFGEEVGRESNTISIQQWEVAKTVYRYTLSQPLPPGEYALAEILPDGLNLFVWDFGVDGKK